MIHHEVKILVLQGPHKQHQKYALHLHLTYGKVFDHLLYQGRLLLMEHQEHHILSIFQHFHPTIQVYYFHHKVCHFYHMMLCYKEYGYCQAMSMHILGIYQDCPGLFENLFLKSGFLRLHKFLHIPSSQLK
mgnify:CR=1 FL=1